MKASDVKQKMQNQPKASSNLRNKFRSQKSDLMQRHQEQIDNKDQGNEFPTIFDKSLIPKGIGFWKAGKGDHEIDIIPFFAGNQHNRVPEGKVAYVVDLYVHTNVGPLRTPYPCSAKNFKETDPICEYISKNRLSKEDWKKVASKRRTAYLVWVHDTPEEEKKGLQIWEVAHFFFEQHIDEIAKTPRGGGAIPFSDVEVGKSIAFSIKSTGKYNDGNTERESISYSGHRFIDRQTPEIPDHILDQIFPLDEVIMMRPDYEEMETAFYGPSKAKKDIDPDAELDETQEEEQTEFSNTYTEDDIPSEGQKAPKGSGKKAPKPEPEPQVEEEEVTNIICPVCKGKGQSKKGQTCRTCDGIGEIPEEETEEEVTEEEVTEEENAECPHDPDSFGEVDEHPECEADGGCPL